MNTTIAKKIKKIKLLATDVDGVLTDAGAYYSEEGVELKKFNIRDGMGIVLLRKAGYKVAIVTTENTKIVEKRAQRMMVDDLHQGVYNKMIAMEELRAQYELDWSEIAFIGDDVNDLEVLKKAGLACVPSDAMPVNKKVADVITKATGGHGCVREVCDLILAQEWKGEKISALWLKKV